MKKKLPKIKNNWSFFLPIFLVGVSLALSFANYKPGTWLSGWDTLHPEFNFSLYFKRIFFGVWQEHQGLGALATQAHAAELPRMLLYWPLSLVLPASVLRYAYFFLTWLVGTLGMYFFLKFIFKKPLAAEVGSLFYLLNLVTLQQYYLPLEMFATHFAALPWLFFFALKFIQNKHRKDLIIFSIFTLFSTSQAHTPTLFYAYFLGLAAFVLTLGGLKRKLQSAFLLLILTLVINSFWLLPNLYFVLTSGPIVPNSKISMQFSSKALLTSQKFGNFSDMILMKNYLFDWGKYSQKEKAFVPLFREWRRHLNLPLVKGLEIFWAILALAGIIIALAERFEPGMALLPVFGLAFFFIGGSLPGVKEIQSILQDKVPLFKEGLRFAFTKFSFLFSFAYASFLALSFDFWLSKIKGRFWSILTAAVLSGAIIYSVWPAFKGNFINAEMKVNFPAEYFAVQKWFADKKERVAAFPVTLFWGWNYYDWGYEGAGFWWFGLPGPFLDREFDRWSPYNEQYYWEISYAVYAKNLALLESILAKYQVRYLLLDENIINPSSRPAVYFEELKQLFAASGKIKLVCQFGKISVYEYQPAREMVTLAQNLPTIGPDYKWTNEDQAYAQMGDYITSPQNSLPNIYFPFRSLFTGRSPREVDFEITETADAYILTKQLPPDLRNYKLKLPDSDGKELLWLNPQDFSDFKYLIPRATKSEDKVEVIVPKVGGYFSAEFNPKAIKLAAADGQTQSQAFWQENLLQKYGYLIKIEAKNLRGQSLLFWLEDLTAKRADLELYLPHSLPNTAKGKLETYYLIQPPMNPAGLGYAFHFDSVSFGRERTENELGQVTVNLLPYQFLTGLALVSPENSTLESLAKKAQFSQPEAVFHPNPSLYEVELTKLPENSTLVLSQSFHSGWKAYFIDNSKFKIQNSKLVSYLAPILGKEIKEHVLVNNWENGWQLNQFKVQSSKFKVILVFWPQYLEYFGLALLVVAVVTLLWRQKTYDNSEK